MRASVIIPTYNRSAQLAELLHGLTLQEGDYLQQVLVCDDGSSDNTREVCDGFRDRLPLVYCAQEHRGFRAGQARNLGIRRAAGDVLVFVDDDCLVLPGFVAAHCAAHAGEVPVVGLGRRCRRRPAAAGAGSGEADNREPCFAAGLEGHPAPWKLLYSCNLSVRRGHPDAYFDERFTGWGMEDTDLGYRLWQARLPFRLVEGATVLHVDDELPRDPFRREVLGLEPDYRSYLENCVRLLDKFRGEAALWDGLFDDLSWYAWDPARHAWRKDGRRHDPRPVIEAVRNSLKRSEPAVNGFASGAAVAPGVLEWSLQRPLQEIAIEFSGYCNLSCVMCSVWKIRQHGIPHDLLRRTLEQARALGARKLTPCGAEVFMRPDTLDLLEYAKALGFEEIVVVTNGLLLTPDRLDRLGRLAALHVNISIDGPAEVHDRLRGPGAFGRVAPVLGELRRRGIPFGLSAVLMRQTLDRIEEVIDLAAEAGARAVSLQPYQPEIGGRDNDHAAFGFQAGDEAMIGRRLDEIGAHAARRGLPIFTGSLLPLVPAYLARGQRPIPRGGCFVPSRFLLVDYKGDVYPCFFMRGRRIGSVYEQGIDALWHNRVQRELNLLALREQCPGCLAACSDIETYNRSAGKGVAP
jgi:MoaA/NifB/PqqE/SkfB family radical SAM enzyme/glycosyltransferase involved in cell wall biosynthesis